ncbi:MULTISPECIES: GNAT family N-acetyltransferase [Vibrio]|uniref:GNAT family N-acetyltransferase n=2 Tax=Vibrio TaxID=662 RepID=A0A2N7NNF0_9VIBR|nr:GNAT family N-acetyltransferase [Vibrio tasmaniensis]PMP18380.1 GNAT family N-acetyltransferase [Vibrio tasmaniensis]TKG30024.1 GNAT family N-acetyltransferase [Vibrio tasmaniensis]TKG39747.1 GNAT family N-acetyltransferase [Vibrio tasmaniensis]TKG52005.1 GNAT family N-acetyltransferase [Vibrio tasmaniensis]TKG52910.1 GNAT family N-acetyltransferase [Vibrio tasmaniensis]
MKGFRISTNNDELDLNVIHQFVSTSYWAQGIPKSALEKAVLNSFCFGVFESSGSQVGFARLITDKATFAYLADVFILESHRGIGLSKWLVKTVVEHPDLQGLRRMVLATRDAHGLYSQYGFKPIENPEILMQIWHPNIYNKSTA